MVLKRNWIKSKRKIFNAEDIKEKKGRKSSKKKADGIFSIWVRLRDSDDYGIATCFTCGRKVLIEDIQNGHHIQRQFLSVRYNEYNNNAQCCYCNCFLEGNQAEYRERLIEKIGINKYNILNIVPRYKKIFTHEYDYIVEEYIDDAYDLAVAKKDDKSFLCFIYSAVYFLGKKYVFKKFDISEETKRKLAEYTIYRKEKKTLGTVIDYEEKRSYKRRDDDENEDEYEYEGESWV